MGHRLIGGGACLFNVNLTMPLEAKVIRISTGGPSPRARGSRAPPQYLKGVAYPSPANAFRMLDARAPSDRVFLRQGQFQGQYAKSGEFWSLTKPCNLLKLMVPEVGVEPTRS